MWALPRAWLRGPGCLGGNKGTDSSSRRLIEAFNFLTASAHVLQNFLKNNLIWGSKQDNNTSSQFRFEKSLSNFCCGFDPVSGFKRAALEPVWGQFGLGGQRSWRETLGCLRSRRESKPRTRSARRWWRPTSSARWWWAEDQLKKKLDWIRTRNFHRFLFVMTLFFYRFVTYSSFE